MSLLNVALGVIAGFVIAGGGFLLAGASAWALYRWATEFASPTNPALEDEDEIDHRFHG